MTTIVLTRHGQTEWNIEPRRFRGRAEVPLTDVGRAQARVTAEYIGSAWKPCAVYTSPLGRCIETAQYIGGPLGLEARCLDGLCDIDYGEWQGLTEGGVSERWPEALAAWKSFPHLVRIPSGETLQAMYARVVTALYDILRTHANDTVVMVGHDSVNRLILLDMLGLPLSSYHRLAQGNCAVNELRFEDSTSFIGSINETFHLRPTMRADAQRAAPHNR